MTYKYSPHQMLLRQEALKILLGQFGSKNNEKGMPKYLEWYGAFSLMVTLVWLYLEILRLLAKLRSR